MTTRAGEGAPGRRRLAPELLAPVVAGSGGPPVSAASARIRPISRRRSATSLARGSWPEASGWLADPLVMAVGKILCRRWLPLPVKSCRLLRTGTGLCLLLPARPGLTASHHPRQERGRGCVRAFCLSLRGAFSVSLRAEDASGRSRPVADAFRKPVASGGSGGETPELEEPDGPSSSLRGDWGLPSRARTWGGNEHAPAGPQLRGVTDVPVDRVAGGRDRPCRLPLQGASRLRLRAPPRQCPRPEPQGRAL